MVQVQIEILENFFFRAEILVQVEMCCPHLDQNK
jgi:hypothetical protein